MFPTPLPGFKPCRKCGEVKPLADFHMQSDMKDGRRHDCKICHARAHQRWYERNREHEVGRVRRWQQANPERVNASHRRRRAKDPEAIRRKDREGHLRRKYALTENFYRAMVLAQLGKCAVCDQLTAPHLHVDHDHGTKKVRGLLGGNAIRPSVCSTMIPPGSALRPRT